MMGAITISQVLDIIIGFITVSVLIGGGVWKLRKWLSSDTRNIVNEVLRPFAQTQQDHTRDIAEIKEWRPKVDTKLQTHSEEIAYLKGKEDARSELANGLGGAGRIIEAVHHQEDKE